MLSGRVGLGAYQDPSHDWYHRATGAVNPAELGTVNPGLLEEPDDISGYPNPAEVEDADLAGIGSWSF